MKTQEKYKGRDDAGVYKITNITTNKIYIGSTTNFQRRWWSHRCKSNKGCKKLHNAIQKYGKDSFLFERIEYVNINNLTRKQAEKKLQPIEQIYLDFYQPFNKRGYNICESAANDHQQIGSHLYNHNKPVSCFSLDGRWVYNYPSMKEAAKDKHIIATSITDCCKGIKKSAGGFMWAIPDGTKQLSPYKSNTKKPVLQFSKTGEFIKEWKAAKDAAAALKLSPGNISNCCSDKYPGVKSIGGFVWKFKGSHLPKTRP